MGENTSKDLTSEIIGFVKNEGFRIIDTLVSDFGKTIKLVVEKDNKKSVLPIVECFYDTDSKANRAKWHGMFDIRMTPWYKNKKMGIAS